MSMIENINLPLFIYSIYKVYGAVPMFFWKKSHKNQETRGKWNTWTKPENIKYLYSYDN